MKETLLSIDWKSYGTMALSWLLTVVMLYAIIPNLGKIPATTGKLFDWLRLQAGHVKNQFAAGVLTRLSDLVLQGVLAVENTAIEDLKAMAAKGALTTETLKEGLLKVKSDVIAQVKAHATAQELWADALIIFGDESTLLKWLETELEAHVAQLPPSGLQTVHPTLEADGNLSAMEQGEETKKKAPATDIVGAVTKALLIFMLPFVLFSSVAFAQEKVATDIPYACQGLGCVTYNVGPSIPFLEYDPGATHPVSVLPGVGVQLSISMEQFQKAIGGKSWDMLDLQLMAFGSLVSKNGTNQQFGALSLAVAACTMNSLVCIGGGKHLLEIDGTPAAKDGWFLLLNLSLNIALTPKAPPLGIAEGAAGLERGNTVYMGPLR